MKNNKVYVRDVPSSFFKHISNGKFSLSISGMPLIFSYDSLNDLVGSSMEDIASYISDLEQWIMKDVLESNIMNYCSIRIANSYGDEFSTHFDEDCITIWNHAGNTHIITIEGDTFTDEMRLELVDAMNDYSKDIIRCSSCGNKIRTRDAGGRIFASVFCKKCWDREYKDKAAEIYYD